MANIAKIKELLGDGLSNEVVSQATGVSPSYISQLMAEDNFKNEVIELRTKALQANTKRDRQIDYIEDNLLDKLRNHLDLGIMMRPAEALRAFAIVNRAVRRGVTTQENISVNQVVVSLQLPTVIVKNFTLNSQSEVIEVDGQTMVTMPSAQLLKNLVEQSTANGEANDKYSEIAKYIPGGYTHEAKLSPQLQRAKELVAARRISTSNNSANESDISVETGREQV